MIPLAEFHNIKFISASVDAQTFNNNAHTPAYWLSLCVGRELLSKHKKDRYFSSAQLVSRHKENELLGENLLVVVNLPRKQIGKLKSDCLVTGLQDENLDINERIKNTVAVKMSEPVPDGSLISISGQQTVLTENHRDLSFHDFQRADIRVGTVIGVEIDKTIKQLLRVDCGPVGEKLASTPWNSLPKDMEGKQMLVAINLNSDDLPLSSTADAWILTPKEGVWCMPVKPCENGYRLA